MQRSISELMSENKVFIPDNFDDKGVPLTDYPEPLLYNLMVRVFTKKEMTAGGIIVPDETVDRESSLSDVGLIVAVGPEAYKGSEFTHVGALVGQWVHFRTHDGKLVPYKGVKFRAVPDSAIGVRVEDPNHIKSTPMHHAI